MPKFEVGGGKTKVGRLETERPRVHPSNIHKVEVTSSRLMLLRGGLAPLPCNAMRIPCGIFPLLCRFLLLPPGRPIFLCVCTYRGGLYRPATISSSSSLSSSRSRTTGLPTGPVVVVVEALDTFRIGLGESEQEVGCGV